jgi:hypothetical protein
MNIPNTIISTSTGLDQNSVESDKLDRSTLIKLDSFEQL